MNDYYVTQWGGEVRYMMDGRVLEFDNDHPLPVLERRLSLVKIERGENFSGAPMKHYPTTVVDTVES